MAVKGTICYTIALANCHRPSNSCVLHRHCGLILHTVDTSVAVPAQVIYCLMLTHKSRVAETGCDEDAPVTGPTAARVQAVTLFSANFYTVGNA